MSRIVAFFPAAAVAVVVFGSFFNGQSVVVDEPIAVTAWLLAAVPAVAVLLIVVPWAPSLFPLWRSSRVVVVSFAGLLLWAAVRAVGVQRCLTMRDGEVIGVCFPDWVAWIPLVQAGVTMLLAWLCVAYIPVAARNTWLTVVASAVVGMSCIALIRALLHPRGFNRLGSGLGGAAVLPVALIIASAALCGAYLLTRRKLLLVTAVIGVVLLLLTFSRAGLAVAIVVAGALLWCSRGGLRRINAKALAAVAAGGVLCMGILAVIFPQLAARLFTLGDSGRAENLVTALTVWGARLETVLFGAGTAGVWPWYGVDANLVWAPETGMVGVRGISGSLLVNPHSTVLGVAVEQGLVGLVLLAVTLIAVIRNSARYSGVSPVGYAALASGIVIAGFFFDTYLIRNPGVSFVWWFAVFIAGLGTSEPAPPQGSGRLSERLN